LLLNLDSLIENCRLKFDQLPFSSDVRIEKAVADELKVALSKLEPKSRVEVAPFSIMLENSAGLRADIPSTSLWYGSIFWELASALDIYKEVFNELKSKLKSKLYTKGDIKSYFESLPDEQWNINRAIAEDYEIIVDDYFDDQSQKDFYHQFLSNKRWWMKPVRENGADPGRDLNRPDVYDSSLALACGVVIANSSKLLTIIKAFKSHEPLRLVFSNQGKYEEIFLKNSLSTSFLKINIKDKPSNEILYGPPGTGKTFSTIDRVVQVLDSSFKTDDRGVLKERYDQLVNNGQVIFTTFHQSYSYEDFVEGIRAKANTESKSISYDVEPGVFKKICESASDFEVAHKSKLEGGLANRKVWKMSLGNTYIGEEDSVYDYCIENEVILLGYGDDVDFSNCKNSTQVYDEYKNAYEEVKPKDFAIQVVNTFVNKINKGDLVIISDGNHKFRAIAEITGDYYCLTREQAEASYFQQARSVKWLLTYDQSRPKEELFKKNLSQMTLYQLHDRTVSREKLELLLKDDAPAIQDKQYAIVIDEINRGNISKIFGELITLIEPSKREGQPEALSVTLPYSKEPFSVPSNLHIIGTMNTADRSLALLDTALRRRFDFIEMMPDYDVLKNEADDNYQVKGIHLALMLKAMNDRIEYLYDREHILGHAFLIPVVELIKNGDEGKAFEELKIVFMNKILPLLEEYFYEDWSKIALVLGDNQKDSTALIEQRFVVEQAGINVSALFGRNHAIDDYGIENKCYQLNTAMQDLTAAAFIAIYDVDKAKSLTDKLITSDVTPEETV
jgi:Cdc6-like AAA superfamily ATPase